MTKASRIILFGLFLLLVIFAVMNAVPGANPLSHPEEPTKLNLSEIQKYAQEHRDNPGKGLAEVHWQGTDMTGKYFLPDGSKHDFVANVVNAEGDSAGPIISMLSNNNVNFQIEKPPISTGILNILSFIALPLMMFALLYFFFIRPAQMGGNQALNFGRSKAKRVGENGIKVTFEDVAGIEEAKQELYEIVDFLKNTKKYTALGAKIPKGILLTGPPGVGKTHLARAIAGEAGVPFFHISGSDFVEMFVGVGAARVRDLFETAKAHRPSLIFVDEIDAVGRQRGAGLGGGHDEREQTLNQLLVEMDGFDPNSGVILIAATNRPDVLDPALLRPGRFDRQIVVDVPDARGREAILQIHSKGKPLEPEINLESLSKRTPGFTGADLANMLNEGALLAARGGHSKIAQSDLEEALDRVIAGPQRKSRVLDAHEREVIAYHEAGHAIVGELLEHTDPVHKVTILPRGMSLGSTWSMPETDKYLVSEQELIDDITGLLGGRVAEEIVFNEITTGASNDLQRVTAIARAMICEYGMSEKLGTLVLGRRSHNPFLGRDYVNDERNYSEDVAKMIDEEIRKLVDSCHTRASDILTSKRDVLDRLVQELLEHETLNREDFLLVLAGSELPKVDRGSAKGLSERVKSPGAKESEKPPKATLPRLEPGPA